MSYRLEQVDQSRAEFEIARACVAELQAIIDKKTLKAPFDAVAGLHELEVGEFLPSNTTIVVLVGIHDYAWVDFNLSMAQGTLDLGAEVDVVSADSTSGGVLPATASALFWWPACSLAPCLRSLSCPALPLPAAGQSASGCGS